jgi:adenylate kinase
MRVLGVAGCPGTGKRSVGRLVAEVLGWPYYEINEVAFRAGAILERDEWGYIADPPKIREALLRELKAERSVVVGHLLPQVLRRGETIFVAVLRCSPYELWERLAARGYPEDKIRNDVEAEILGYCLAEAVEAFGQDRVAEFDTTGRRPEEVADELLATFRGDRAKRLGAVDWLKLVTERGDLTRFFSYKAH